MGKRSQRLTRKGEEEEEYFNALYVIKEPR
jgi:hypothetical protein